MNIADPTASTLFVILARGFLALVSESDAIPGLRRREAVSAVSGIALRVTQRGKVTGEDVAALRFYVTTAETLSDVDARSPFRSAFLACNGFADALRSGDVTVATVRLVAECAATHLERENAERLAR